MATKWNPHYVLSFRQKSLIIAILLTDGWLSQGKNYKTPLVGLQLCERNKPLLLFIMRELQPLIRDAEPKKRLRGAPGSDPNTLFAQFYFRTVNHPQLSQFVIAFNGEGKNKTVPKVSYLMQYLTLEAVAVLFMCDGSRKGQGRGMEIHLQGFQEIPQKRLCIAMYKKFGIKCYTSNYGLSKAGQMQYHIQVSGFSHPIIYDKIRPLMLPEFQYKIPDPATRKTIDTWNSPWSVWYRTNKEGPWQESFEFDELC